jgi:hypothetical protein
MSRLPVAFVKLVGGERNWEKVEGMRVEMRAIDVRLKKAILTERRMGKVLEMHASAGKALFLCWTYLGYLTCKV